MNYDLDRMPPSWDDRMSQQAANVAAPGEPHLACVLLLDTSGSMRGPAIQSLNEGVARFIRDLQRDEMAKKRLDLAIVEFNDAIWLLQDFLPIGQSTPPNLVARGTTAMGAAVEAAVGMVKERNKLYNSIGVPAHKPWIFMITDGLPTDDIENAVRLVQEEERRGSHGRLKFHSLAVDQADVNILRRFSERILCLRGRDFTSIFDWLAKSMAYISQSQIGDNPPWQKLPDDIGMPQWWDK